MYSSMPRTNPSPLEAACQQAVTQITGYTDVMMLLGVDEIEKYTQLLIRQVADSCPDKKYADELRAKFNIK